MTIFSGRRATVVLIGGALALSYLISEQIGTAPGARFAGTPPVPASVIAPVDESTALTSQAFLQETVERPLFSPTRRAAPETTVAAVPTVVERGRYDLVGVILTGNRRFALIQSEAADRTVRVTVGQRLDRWRVAGIDARSVVLTQRGETQELRLNDDARVRPAVVKRPDAVASGKAEAAAEANTAAAAEPVS